MPPRAAAADAARPAAVRFAQTFRLLAPKGVHHGHHHQAEGAEALAAGDAAMLEQESVLRLDQGDGAEVLVFDLRP